MEFGGLQPLLAPHVVPPHHQQLLVSPEGFRVGRSDVSESWEHRSTSAMQWFVEKRLLCVSVRVC